jgi:hypothetical protein
MNETINVSKDLVTCDSDYIFAQSRLELIQNQADKSTYLIG